MLSMMASAPHRTAYFCPVGVDLIRDIKDPEHPHTLEELNVVSENGISVEYRTSVGDGIKHRTAGLTAAGATVSSSPAGTSDHRGEQGSHTMLTALNL